MKNIEKTRKDLEHLKKLGDKALEQISYEQTGMQVTPSEVKLGKAFQQSAEEEEKKKEKEVSREEETPKVKLGKAFQ